MTCVWSWGSVHMSLKMDTWQLGHRLVGWLVIGCNATATCWCTSGTDLLWELFILPHSNISCRSNWQSHLVTVCWHRNSPSRCWPYNSGTAPRVPVCKSLVWLNPKTNKKTHRKSKDRTQVCRSQGGHLTTRPKRWFKATGVADHTTHWLVGLVVKVSASRVEDPAFESRLCQDFSKVESYQWLKNWHYSGYPARFLVL